jgi:hypothetical protein
MINANCNATLFQVSVVLINYQVDFQFHIPEHPRYLDRLRF